MIIGVACDQFGFDVALLATALISSIFSLIAMFLYEQNSLLSTEESQLLTNEKCQTGTLNSIQDSVDYNTNIPEDYPLMKLLEIAFSTYQRAAFFTVYGLLNVGMAIVENMIFLFYRESLESTKTM